MFHIGTVLTLTLVLVLHPNLVWSEPSSSNTEDANKDTDSIEIIDSIESEVSSDSIDTEPPEDTGGPSLTEQLLEQVDWSRFDLPIPLNESVIYWVEHFSNSGRWSASKWIRASGKYSNLIQSELKRAGLPNRSIVYGND